MFFRKVLRERKRERSRANQSNDGQNWKRLCNSISFSSLLHCLPNAFNIIVCIVTYFQYMDTTTKNFSNELKCQSLEVSIKIFSYAMPCAHMYIYTLWNNKLSLCFAKSSLLSRFAPFWIDHFSLFVSVWMVENSKRMTCLDKTHVSLASSLVYSLFSRMFSFRSYYDCRL